jgi:hypothetical protein
MNRDLLLYLVTGGIAIGGIAPLIALLIYYIKKLDEVRRSKKLNHPAA